MNLHDYEKQIALRLFDFEIKKVAQTVSPETITSGISSFISSSFKDMDAWDVLSKLLNPVAISYVFKFIGISSWWSILAGAVLEYFDIRVADIIKDICSSLYKFVASKTQPSFSDIESIVNEEVLKSFPGISKASNIEQLNYISRRFKTEMQFHKEGGLTSSVAGNALKLFLTHFFSALFGQTFASLTKKPVREVIDSVVTESKPESKHPVKSSFKNQKYFSNVSRSYSIPATQDNVTKFLLDLAGERYDIQGIIPNILNNSEFHEARNLILQESENFPTNTIVIPTTFQDKVSLIDYFMDMVFEEIN